jgi:hypothetical protein
MPRSDRRQYEVPIGTGRKRKFQNVNPQWYFANNLNSSSLMYTQKVRPPKAQMHVVRNPNVTHCCTLVIFSVQQYCKCHQAIFAHSYAMIPATRVVLEDPWHYIHYPVGCTIVVVLDQKTLLLKVNLRG